MKRLKKQSYEELQQDANFIKKKNGSGKLGKVQQKKRQSSSSSSLDYTLSEPVAGSSRLPEEKEEDVREEEEEDIEDGDNADIPVPPLFPPPISQSPKRILKELPEAVRPKTSYRSESTITRGDGVTRPSTSNKPTSSTTAAVSKGKGKSIALHPPPGISDDDDEDEDEEFPLPPPLISKPLPLSSSSSGEKANRRSSTGARPSITATKGKTREKPISEGESRSYHPSSISSRHEIFEEPAAQLPSFKKNIKNGIKQPTPPGAIGKRENYQRIPGLGSDGWPLALKRDLGQLPSTSVVVIAGTRRELPVEHDEADGSTQFIPDSQSQDRSISPQRKQSRGEFDGYDPNDPYLPLPPPPPPPPPPQSQASTSTTFPTILQNQNQNRIPTGPPGSRLAAARIEKPIKKVQPPEPGVFKPFLQQQQQQGLMDYPDASQETESIAQFSSQIAIGPVEQYVDNEGVLGEDPYGEQEDDMDFQENEFLNMDFEMQLPFEEHQDVPIINNQENGVSPALSEIKAEQRKASSILSDEALAAAAAASANDTAASGMRRLSAHAMPRMPSNDALKLGEPTQAGSLIGRAAPAVIQPPTSPAAEHAPLPPAASVPYAAVSVRPEEASSTSAAPLVPSTSAIPPSNAISTSTNPDTPQQGPNIEVENLEPRVEERKTTLKELRTMLKASKLSSDIKDELAILLDAPEYYAAIGGGRSLNAQPTWTFKLADLPEEEGEGDLLLVLDMTVPSWKVEKYIQPALPAGVSTDADLAVANLRKENSALRRQLDEQRSVVDRQIITISGLSNEATSMQTRLDRAISSIEVLDTAKRNLESQVATLNKQLLLGLTQIRLINDAKEGKTQSELKRVMLQLDMAKEMARRTGDVEIRAKAARADELERLERQRVQAEIERKQARAAIFWPAVNSLPPPANVAEGGIGDGVMMDEGSSIDEDFQAGESSEDGRSETDSDTEDDEEIVPAIDEAVLAVAEIAGEIREASPVQQALETGVIPGGLATFSPAPTPVEDQDQLPLPAPTGDIFATAQEALQLVEAIAADTSGETTEQTTITTTSNPTGTSQDLLNTSGSQNLRSTFGSSQDLLVMDSEELSEQDALVCEWGKSEGTACNSRWSNRQALFAHVEAEHVLSDEAFGQAVL